MRNKKEKTKKKKQRSGKNLKISTRIMLTSLLGILIPIILIAAFSPLLIYFTGSYFNISSVTTNSYSTVNQIQWAQTLSSISSTLLSDEEDNQKVESLTEFISPIEKLGSSIYIEKDGKEFYSSKNAGNILEQAGKIVLFDKAENINYFGNNGLVIVNHAKSDKSTYLIVAVNKDYTVSDASTHYTAREFTNLLLGRTGIIALIIVAVFVLAIVIISLITSRTIVYPINRIAEGADEIARVSVISEYCLPYVKTGGYFAAYKSGKAAEELEEGKKAIAVLGGKVEKTEEFLLPDSDMERTILLIKKVKNTPKKYPRKAGTPAKEPIV